MGASLQRVSVLSADVWLERRTLVEKIDSILGHIGMGSNLPDERRFLGRVTVQLPDIGADDIMQVIPVEQNRSVHDWEGPVPITLSIAVEWVDEEVDADQH